MSDILRRAQETIDGLVEQRDQLITERDEAREAAIFLNSQLRRLTMGLEQGAIRKQWPWIDGSQLAESVEE